MTNCVSMSGNALGCLTFSLGFEKHYNCLWIKNHITQKLHTLFVLSLVIL